MEVTSKTESVIVKYEGHVATVMVNRPEVLNALDEPTLKEPITKTERSSGEFCTYCCVMRERPWFFCGWRY